MKQKLNFAVTEDQIIDTPQGKAVLLPNSYGCKPVPVNTMIPPVNHPQETQQVNKEVRYRIIEEVVTNKTSLKDKWMNTVAKVKTSTTKTNARIGKTLLKLGSKLDPDSVEVVTVDK
jgi:hypothetical protein